MNKINKVLLSIIGGMEVLVSVITPILLVLIWLSIFGIENHWSTYAFLIIGWGASMFRAIKIGWLKMDKGKKKINKEYEIVHQKLMDERNERDLKESVNQGQNKELIKPILEEEKDKLIEENKND